MKNSVSDTKKIEPELINSKEVALLLGMSVKWVEINRHKIYGSQKIGRVWRFSLSEIKARIATNRGVIVNR